MHYFDLLVPAPSHLKGIGDPQNDEIIKAQKRDACVKHKGKRDLHNSFPKGLPKIFELERS